MKCKIPGTNVKSFCRSIQFISRVADELFVEASSNWLTLSGVNNRKTAFASVRFEIEFFLSLEVNIRQNNAGLQAISSSQSSDASQNRGSGDIPHCKLAMRSITPLFRGLKQIESAELSIDTANNCFNIEFICTNKITKTHSVAILEFSRLKELKMPDKFDSKIIGTYKTFSEIVMGFHSGTRELCIEVTKTSINMKNHIDNPEEDKKSIRASHQLLTSEFETYAIGNDCKLSYSFPDFKAIISLAELIDANVKIEFGVPGSPMRIATKLTSGLYSAVLICATMPTGEDALNDTYASSTQASAASRQSQPNPGGAVPPVQPPQQINGPPVSVKQKENARQANNQQVIQDKQRPGQSSKRKNQVDRDDGEFYVRSRKHMRSSEGAPSDSDDLLPHMATPDLPRDKAVDEVSVEPPQVVIDESDLQQSNREVSMPPLRVTDVRKTLKPVESVEVLFETESTDGNTEGTEDSVPGSPRQQVYRRLFARCIEPTFRPSMLPGADVILAPDSDEEGGNNP